MNIRPNSLKRPFIEVDDSKDKVKHRSVELTCYKWVITHRWQRRELPRSHFLSPKTKKPQKTKKIYEQHTLFSKDVIKDISEATQQLDFSLKIT